MLSFPDQDLPITLTTKAIAEIKKIMQIKEISVKEYGLRVGIQGGGCSGTSFLLGFDKSKPTDSIYTTEEIAIFIEKKHLMYLLGMEIDYEEGEEESGFVFNNSNDKKS